MALTAEINPLPVNAWDASLQNIVDDMKGRPLNVHGLMAHNTDLLQAWWPLRQHLVSGGSLGSRKGEIVILRVALRMQSWYEWASHVDRALAQGLTENEIKTVQVGGEDPLWDAAEALLLQAVDDLIDQHSLSPDMQNALREHYTVPQIMDLITLHGMYVILGCMINTWGLDLDDHVRDKLPDAFSEDDFSSSS